jgi:site-specific DNA recombinase
MKSRARQISATNLKSNCNAVLDVRVSSKDQEQGFSISAQQKLLTDYADQQGLRVVHKFEDVETAKRAGCTAFDEIVAFLRKGSTCRILLSREN